MFMEIDMGAMIDMEIEVEVIIDTKIIIRE